MLTYTVAQSGHLIAAVELDLGLEVKRSHDVRQLVGP